jgi:hypothetical protein
MKKAERPQTEYEIGELVLLSYPERPPHKLAPRWQGPFEVRIRDRNVYELLDWDTDKTLRVDVKRLRPYVTRPGEDPVQVAQVDKDAYVVEEILSHRGSPRRKRSMTFCVRWAGHDSSEDTWEPWENVKDCEALDRYIQRHPELSRL